MSTVDFVTRLEDAIEPPLAVRVMLGVARLGEADLRGWWSSQGMNAEVRFALAGFRRTSTVVGAELALLSATRRHRQILPRENAVHLFSPHLPFARWARAHLAELKTRGANDPTLPGLAGWTDTNAADTGLAASIDSIAAAPFEGSSVTTADLLDPTISVALIKRLATGYIGQVGDLSMPHVDLVRRS